MSRNWDGWQHALWAWRTKTNFRFEPNGDGSQTFNPPKTEHIYRLPIPPYTTLHHPWVDDTIIAEKRKRYTAIYGELYKDFDPLDFGGCLEELPKWLEKENEN